MTNGSWQGCVPGFGILCSTWSGSFFERRTSRTVGKTDYLCSVQFEKIIQDAIAVVKQAGEFIRTETGSFDTGKVELKSVNQLVSYVDINAEKILVSGLAELIPGCNFITEENTFTGLTEGQYTWIIDPLDGTTNFVHKLPVFSVSVGLMGKEGLVGGIVYEINRDECFYAWKDSPAYLNGKEIQVSAAAALSDSLLATGFPYYDYDAIENYLSLLRHLMKNSQGLRRMGSAAVDLAYVACGRFEAFFEYSLNPWDVAAGAFIVQQAGGRVADFSGGDNYLFGKEIIAANAAIAPEFIAVVKAHFEK